MCGFICIINEKELSNKLNKLSNNNLLSDHRGPDSKKTYSKKNFYGLFRRLAIIDLSQRSNQPFESDDGRYIIFFNGEIYNYLQIKKILKKKNVKFKTKGDAEVLLKAYLFLGRDFIKQIRGMFSFCIWDNKNEKLSVYRDRFGQKPLYYYKTYNGLVVSSEIKDIKNLIDLRENPNAVFKYLYRNILDVNDETFYKKLKRLKPSYNLIYQKNKIFLKKYYSIDFSENKKLNTNEFLENFNENINLHLQSDVKVGFLLSGGLDSSSNVASSLNYQSKLKAFSIFPRHTFSEKKYINSLIKKYTFNHQYVHVEKEINKYGIQKVLSFQDEPFHASNCIYQFFLHKEIKNQNYKVLITGEGGDEVLGGYNRMLLYYLTELFFRKKYNRFSEIIKKNKFNKNLIIKKVNNIKNNVEKNLSDFDDNTSFEFTNEQNVYRNYYNLRWNDIKKIDNLFFKKSLINSIYSNDLQMALRMSDRNCMASSIENRTPFLDHKFAEYVFSHETDDFFFNARTKGMLRASMKNLLSEKILSRNDKTGRPGSDAHFIFNIVYKDFIEILNNSKIDDYGFNKKKLILSLNETKKNIRSSLNNFNIQLKYKTNFYFRVYCYLVWRNLNW